MLKVKINRGNFVITSVQKSICPIWFLQMILCGADYGSFSTIKDALEQLYSFSGLQPNLAKSAASSLFSSVKEEDNLILDIHEAFLPVKSLAVPLISTKFIR